MDNSNNKEQIVNLKDGRTIYKTDNGFTSWVTDARGYSQKITDEYYKKAFKCRV